MSFAIIAFAGVGVGLVGAGVSAYSSIAAGKANEQSANYNAQVQRNNASAANQQAKFDASQISRTTERNVAQQRAAMAASGFDANTGTFTDVTSDTKKQGELDRLSRLYMGAIGMTSSTSGADLYASSARNAPVAGEIGAGASILGGLSSAATTISNPNFAKYA